MSAKPEIMSPAGYWPQLHAAIEAGADSVYFGLTQFSARAKVGFTVEELPQVMQTLHARGVKGYVTFNTLVFDSELATAARSIESIAQSGADAIIVQDLGVCSLVQSIAPDLEIHASTQMSITNADGVHLAQRLGAAQVNLARELSLEDLRKIRAATDCKLEVFVQGALCVAYSGQCFSSEAWGGRSANRGQCAQACRLPYNLLVDGELQPLADARYLLSPGDLYALDHVPALIELGIHSLKIEGRYKDADYVALATHAYRQAVDQAAPTTPAQRLQLEQVYSRGLGDYFLGGTNHQRVVQGRAPRHRGLLMGRVVRIEAPYVIIEPNANHGLAPLKPGDGVVFDAADWRSPNEPEEGGRLFEVTPARQHLTLAFANNAIQFDRLRNGDLLWRTHDPALDHFTKQWTQPNAPVRKIAAQVHAQFHVGERPTLTWRTAQHTVTVTGDTPVAEARQQATAEAAIREQLSRLGNTHYALDVLAVEATGRPFLPASTLNQLRREAVAALDQRYAQTTPKPTREYTPQTRSVAPLDEPVQIHVLIRKPNQLGAAIALRPDSITLDYLDLYGLRPSVERVKAADIAVRVASPRVLKPGEEGIADFLGRLDCGILVRAAGLLHHYGSLPNLTGDFSLNAANATSAMLLLDMGLQRLTPTHDLNAAQITTLAKQIGAHRLEPVIFHHLPVFHTEHCVFCRFLSTGTTYKDCGRPCEKHDVALQDQQGREHPLIADVGCRNTVFGAEAQDASAYLAQWLQAGIRHFRLEFVHQSPEEVTTITNLYREALEETRDFRALQKALPKVVRQGTTLGSLKVLN
jgi:putative protease